MNFTKFTQHVMTTLEFITSLALAYHVYLFAGCSITIAVLSWIFLQIFHTTMLASKAKCISPDDTKALTELIHEYNPIWFVLNSLSIIALSYFI